VIALVLRAHGLGGRPLVLLVTVAVLAVATALPFLAGILLTDIFAGLSVLALYLLVLRAAALKRWERAALLVLVAFSAATHSATLAVLAGLFVVGLAVALARRMLVPFAGLVRGSAALALGAAMLLAANYAVAGRLAWTPGGIALLFGRMLQDGIVARYLAEHCPDARLRLCDHRAELPTDADVFFWGESVFDRLGRFDGLGAEMRLIVLESLAAYPLWQLQAAAAASARQLVKAATGEGIVVDIWHTVGMIEQFAPSALPAMRASRQLAGGIDFTAVNRLHVPAALACMAALFLFVLGMLASAMLRSFPRKRESSLRDPGPRLRGDERSARWRRSFTGLEPLSVTVALAILGNAVVCGALANPHDRYGARMAWLATLVVVIAAWRLASRRPSSPGHAN
jgi:hypothetical protein